MDNLTYGYNLDANGNLQNNKLRHVKDDASFSSNYPDDIDNQADDNYSYDAIGNLTADAKEGISNISWNVYGKIESITKTNGTTINYTYDPSGNRISKVVTSSGVTKTTRYIRDASGNVMSIYVTDPLINSGAMTQTEAHMYGSSRLGVWNVNRDVSSIACIDYSNFRNTFIRGNKFFELSNHLGNVLVTISDKQIGVDNGTNSTVFPDCNPPAGVPNYHCAPPFTTISGSPDGVVDYYTADVITANDYYPGGMEMPGRQFSQPNNNYRYGFNGKEKDKESPVQYDYGFRIYDPRLTRFKSVDPLTSKYAMLTPYQFASNSPISGIDVDGLEYLNSNEARIKIMNGKVYINLDNLSAVAKNSYDEANKALGGVKTWTDENGKLWIGPALSSKVGEFSFTNGDKPLESSPVLPQLIKNTSPENKEIIEPPSDQFRPSGGADERGRMPSIPENSPSSNLAKGAAGGIIILDAIILGSEIVQNWLINEEVDKIKFQMENYFGKVLNDVVSAANQNLINHKYLNTKDLSSIMNVVLTGVNNTDDPGIYETGIMIYNMNKPVTYTKPTGLDFMQNMPNKRIIGPSLNQLTISPAPQLKPSNQEEKK